MSDFQVPTFYQYADTKRRYNFIFDEFFVAGDTVDSESVTIAPDLKTSTAHSDRTVQVLVDTAGTSAGAIYSLKVKATATSTLSDELECKIIIRT
jgi:hypothetical protein